MNHRAYRIFVGLLVVMTLLWVVTLFLHYRDTGTVRLMNVLPTLAMLLMMSALAVQFRMSSVAGAAPPSRVARSIFWLWVVVIVIQGYRIYHDTTATPAERNIQLGRGPYSMAGFGDMKLVQLDDTANMTPDGWLATATVTGARTVPAPDGSYSIRLQQMPDAGGDVEHYQVQYLTRKGESFDINNGTATFAWITPDSRWVITGTLEVLDTKRWRSYSVSTEGGVEPYVVLHSISPNGRTLRFSRRLCPFDCRDIPDIHYQLTFPAF